jgi:hypothetical protein
MRATILWLGALLVIGAAASQVQADPYSCPYIFRQAPDMCGTGYFCTNYCGAVYGPNYCVRPPWEPFNGFRPCLEKPQQQQHQASPILSNPFVRSPRDFFMMEPAGRSGSGW